MVRTIVKQEEVYLNAGDLINTIERHKRNTTGDKQTTVSQVYALAHDHIIEIINIYTGGKNGSIR